jgi:hypothetical protein
MTMTPPSSIDAAEVTDRWALAAGRAFLDGTAMGAWGITGLRSWFQDHLVAHGHMHTPVSVSEPPVGTFTLYPQDASALEPQASLPALLSVARSNVLGTLRAFVDKPADDRWVTSALFSGRVHRARSPLPRPGFPGARTHATMPRWIPRPDAGGPLSALVLSLFVIDLLTHREAYDRSFCVCDVCGRVSFQEGAARRRSCPAHGSRPSSLVPRVVLG